MVPPEDGAGEDIDPPAESGGDAVMQENSDAEESVEDGVDEEVAQRDEDEDESERERESERARERGDQAQTADASAARPPSRPGRGTASGERVATRSTPEGGETRADVQHPRCPFPGDGGVRTSVSFL